MLYVGVDTHKINSYLTIIDAEGNVLRQQQVPTRRQALAAALSDYAEPLSACLEAGYHWGPVYDWLDEVCDEVTLVNPARVRLIGESLIKTDKIDSGILAQLLRVGMIPQAYAASAVQRMVRRVLRQRIFLVGQRTALKNRIHNLLAQHEARPPDVSDLFGAAGMAWLNSLELPGHDDTVLGADLELLGQLTVHIRRCEALIAEIAAGDEVVGWLRSIPGIGKFLSVLIRYEVGRIDRFAGPKKFASYTGLVPATRCSGGTVRHGRITKAGNPPRRAALGADRGGEPGSAHLPAAAGLLPGYQAAARRQRCPGGYRPQARCSALACLDGRQSV